MNQKIDNNRTIGVNDLQENQNYADLSHAVHMGMMGHTGRVSTFGMGVLTAKLSKKKMNLRSSNKSEVIGNN